MLSKEEILGRPEFLPRDNVPDYLRTMYDPKKVLAAMDEYAKQEAIGFAKFLDDLKINADKHFNNPRTGTTEELYDYYLKTEGHATK